MTLRDQIRTAPIPNDPDRASDVAAPFAAEPKAVRRLLLGSAGCSGYLAALIRQEAGWLTHALGQPAEVAFDQLLTPETGDLAVALRQIKRRAALLIALADLGGVWSLSQVTEALTRLADHAVQRALSHLIKAEQDRGKLPVTKAPDGGVAIFAMGKMGAGELNYSSDIDLVVLFDEGAYAEDDYHTARAGLIRVTQRLVKLLAEVTGDGYVFRTDLRLRPDPSVTPVCISMEAAERYYESYGRTWERAAWIKARVCAGDLDAGARFLGTLSPFIWRRHLDYAAIEDAHDIRRRIRSHKGLGGPITLLGHDMKLGRGGIREIEFFTQTRQLICGGRDPSLRHRETQPALEALAGKGWISADVADRLKDAYVAHRTLEHRLQMVDDAQTHSLPKSDDGLTRIAEFSGAEDPGAFWQTVRARLEEVNALTEPFFQPGAETSEDGPDWSGFASEDKAAELADRWADLPSLRAPRAQQIFTRLAPQIAERLAQAQSPDEALIQFDRFLSGLPAGVQVFSLFEANPQLLDLLVDICATAPNLAEYLGRNAGVLDAVIGQGFFDPPEGAASLAATLRTRLERTTDYETALDETRRFVKDRKFRTGVHLLRGIASPIEAAEQYSDIAEATLGVLFPAVTEAFAKRFGSPPGNGAAVVAMGKLGTAEMTATSDLDLIVVYDAARDAQSDGPKSLPASAYYARLTQALVSALTSPTAEGVLYRTDMRLRPSGRKGPLATSLNAFAAYQASEAWTWEHLALTRARAVAGAKDVQAGVCQAISDALSQPHDEATVLRDVADMRARLAGAKSPAGPWGIKAGPGRLLDVELLMQTGVLVCALDVPVAPRLAVDPLVAKGWLTPDEGAVLTDGLRLYSCLQQIGRLAAEDGFVGETAGQGLTNLVLQLTETPSVPALGTRLESVSAACAEIITRKLAARQ